MIQKPATAECYSSTIGDLARRFDLSYRTLRFYEDLKLISPVRVGSTRMYSKKDETRLEMIITGKKLGFSLHQIKCLIGAYVEKKRVDPPAFRCTLSHDLIQEQILALESKKKALEETIAQLRLMVRVLGCQT